MKHIAPLLILTTLLVSCGRKESESQAPDPLLATGERAIVGTYGLYLVDLGPGRLVRLNREGTSDMTPGDTLEQAAAAGLLTSEQVAVLKKSEQCILEVMADHTFTVSNLPVSDFSLHTSFQGTWSMQVYHAFSSHGYRISMQGGPSGDLKNVIFPNADNPSPPELQIAYQQGKRGLVGLRFHKIVEPPQ